MGHTRPSLREHALSDQQWRVLRQLGEHGAVETGRVAREAFILGPSLTGVLARMERDEPITRSRDPEDQRRAPWSRPRRTAASWVKTLDQHRGALRVDGRGHGRAASWHQLWALCSTN